MKILKWFTFILVLLTVIWFIRLPDCIVYSDTNLTSQGNREVELQVVVYKSKYNSVLYDMIAKEHRKINGTPDKLIMKLYHTLSGMKSGKDPYRTIVFDYENNLSYILLSSGLSK